MGRIGIPGFPALSVDSMEATEHPQTERKKSTKAQKELSRKERKKNMERAFVVKKEAGMYRDILLVDDIYTTGSTANAIAGKLKAVGVKNVYVLTLCIGKGI